MELEILRQLNENVYLVRQDETYHMAFPEAGYYVTPEYAETFLEAGTKPEQVEEGVVTRIEVLLNDPEAKREMTRWQQAELAPNYYLLDEGHLTPFLPFLYPSGRKDAQAGRVRVIGVTKEKLAVGALAFSVASETAVIQSVAVSPEYQGRGLAVGLLQYLRDVLPLLDCWEITAVLAPELPEREAMEAVLRSAGFQQEKGPEWIDCPLSAFQAASSLQPFFAEGNRKNAVALSKVPELARRSLSLELQEKGAPPLDWESFDPELSFCGMPDGKSISCCVCLSRREKGVQVEWLYVRSNAARTMAEILAAAISASVAIYGPEGRCTAVLVNEASGTMLDKLVGSAARKTETFRWRLPLLDGEEDSAEA